ncbi:hypothetical protein CLAFUW4_10826 [Fulvia fulva]|uniref:Uncharacterized protein n=1 Tax=Passalora fulva TaxID=5499 RepID=A0A9Q8PD72_PASFU|nr:uncharacterized protein CLAFUR5_09870 [Fulvia fulva]KAK4619891.1 hypothetical protein CLAFUR4_10831 [Fulvia fulva]KAK4620333.1 hypothetical protein CLAFUR0_10838 [Fulvia fulva]UJO20281.1 hypothetical protein CLAFUR5_09870 [Fulvia fulva]WPV17257.1 hypothetical protein CLAFUW4_10826 [Fulvia fulva]WPV32457.1 hypothetical protein CLAFUW7_10824 [Fulvia fulva]
MVKSAVEVEGAEVVKRLGDKQIEVDRLREELEMVKSQLPTKLDGSKKKKKLKLVSEEAFDDLKMQVGGLASEHKKLQQENASSKADIASARAREAVATQNHHSIQFQVNALSRTIGSISPPDTVVTRLSTLESDVQSLQSIPPADLQAGLLASKVTNLEADTREHKSQHSELRTKVTKVERKVHSLNAETTDWTETLVWVKNFNLWVMGQLDLIGDPRTIFPGVAWKEKAQKEKSEEICGCKLPGPLEKKKQ